VKSTFSLKDVPREAYYMGLAGTLPYLATSFATVYLAWELKHTTAGIGYLLSEANATYLLHLLEPIQIGYGASILSFLGAIHWGLEWAGYGGYQGYKRYAIGVVAPLVAASTLLMPIEGALITQFIGFVALYYVDTSTLKPLSQNSFPTAITSLLTLIIRSCNPWLDAPMVRRLSLCPDLHCRCQSCALPDWPRRVARPYSRRRRPCKGVQG